MILTLSIVLSFSFEFYNYPLICLSLVARPAIRRHCLSIPQSTSEQQTPTTYIDNRFNNRTALCSSSKTCIVNNVNNVNNGGCHSRLREVQTPNELFTAPMQSEN